MATEKKYYLPEGLPAPRAQRDGLDKEFWDATRRHELVVQRCNGCGTFQWGPEWICHKCHSADHLGWQKVSGHGRLFSWIRNWNPVHPALKEACPYIVAAQPRLPFRLLGGVAAGPLAERLPPGALALRHHLGRPARREGGGVQF